MQIANSTTHQWIGKSTYDFIESGKRYHDSLITNQANSPAATQLLVAGEPISQTVYVVGSRVRLISSIASVSFTASLLPTT